MEHKDKKKPCDIIKKPVGRPKKIRRLEMSLISNISPILQSSFYVTKARVRGPYTNWFTPKLWLSIEAAMKQHKNHIAALKYLRIAHHTNNTSTGPYDKLSRGGLNEWFTHNGEIRGHVLQENTHLYLKGNTCHHFNCIWRLPHNLWNYY